MRGPRRCGTPALRGSTTMARLRYGSAIPARERIHLKVARCQGEPEHAWAGRWSGPSPRSHAAAKERGSSPLVCVQVVVKYRYWTRFE